MIKSKFPVIQTTIYIYIYIFSYSSFISPQSPDTTLYARLFSCDNVGKKKRNQLLTLQIVKIFTFVSCLFLSLSATKGSVEGLIKSHAMCTQTKHLKSCKMHKTTMDNNSQKKKKKTSNKAPNLQKSMKYRNRYQQQLISFKPIF